MNTTIGIKKITDFTDKSLLLVDDDNPFRERLARAMEKKGFEVIQAEGVKKGIDAVKSKKPLKLCYSSPYRCYEFNCRNKKNY